jgi:fucose 4-O-acetylase-like acetyltransferase
MNEEGHGGIEKNRIYWMDNLRSFMIFLVVLLHTGLVYESSGIVASFWIIDDPSTNDLSGIINLIIDIFAMPTLFLISGFLAPLSLRQKKAWAFLKSKFNRLVIPWVVAVLTLLPLYKVLFLYSRGLPQENWTTYFHWSNGIWGQNWLWFLPVLFLFNMLYLFFSRLGLEIPGLTLKRVISAAFLISLIYTLCVDMFNGQGWTKTILIDFQNERLLIYFMAFLVGSFCYKLRTFDSDVGNAKLYILVGGSGWIPICLYLFLIIYSLIRPGEYIFSEMVDLCMIRLSFLVSSLTLIYLLVNTFRSCLDKQGQIGRALSRNTYHVYIIHVVVMGGIALTMLDTTIPSLLKYLIVTVSTYAASNLLIFAHKKITRLRISIRSLNYRRV